MIHSKLIIYFFEGYDALFALENHAMKCLSSSFCAMALMAIAGTASAAQLNNTQANQVIASVLSIPHVVALGGGYPLELNGEVVGAVGVSTPKQEIDNQASQTAAGALK